MGFSWVYRTIDSRAFGIPPRRTRLFFFASRFRRRPAARMDSISARVAGAQPHSPPKTGGVIPPAIWFPDGRIGTPDIRDAERLQGFPPDWTHGISLRARWRAVGNAVNVAVSQWIAERILRSPFPAAYNLGRGRVEAEASTWPVAIPSPPLQDFLQFPPGPLEAVRAWAGE